MSAIERLTVALGIVAVALCVPSAVIAWRDHDPRWTIGLIVLAFANTLVVARILHRVWRDENRQ